MEKKVYELYNTATEEVQFQYNTMTEKQATELNISLRNSGSDCRWIEYKDRSKDSIYFENPSDYFPDSSFSEIIDFLSKK